ncbi:hypothetical protein GCK32_018511 [Trichostrongylus colubriformis]|uniref:Uncharacterized protein n=1 Tax=Trichostrongylus colubriformis TaxID=6319 RepID=A0AAN8EVC1_TRICO
MARGNKRSSVEEDLSQDMPLWATKMIEMYESCCERIEKALTSSVEKMAAKITKIEETQESILSRLKALEVSIGAMKTSSSMTQGALYSTIVKVRADEAKIEDKLRRIAWVGIGEQKDDIKIIPPFTIFTHDGKMALLLRAFSR